ncbi:hypothetical protein Tco_0833568 [Tanacetum coccineum]
MKSVSLKQRLARKRSLKKQWVHRESVSKQGRKFAKGEPTVHKDPLFDEIPEDSLDYMETKDAQDEGRTRDEVDEEKENAEDVLSTAQQKVSTDRRKQKDSTDDQNEGTDEQSKGTDEHTEEGRATQTTQPPTSTIFGDDETIAQVLLNMSQAKAVSREKEKGVEFKDIEETERPRPTSTRSLLTLKPLPKIDPKDKGKKKIEEEDESESESDGIPEAEKKFKQLASDEEMARKVQEEWEGEEERKRLAEEEATNDALIRNYDDIKARIEADRLLAEKLQEEEREQFTIEERAKFLHDTIVAQRKFLAQQRSEAIRNIPPTKNQLRNQMITYLKHVGNFKHADLKTKKFEEIQALYEKIKRSDEDFISIGEDEHKKCLKIVTFESIIDIEIMEKKSVIARLNKVSSPDGDYLVIYRANGNFRAFNYLMEVLHIFDKQDLFHLYDLIRDQFLEVTLDGFELILWGDLKIMMESSTEGIKQKFEDGIVIHMLVERRYPLSKDLLQKMLDLGLEVERESYVALDLIRHKNWLVHKQTACGKDFSNPFMVDNLPKIVGFSTHLASLVKSWLVQDQTVLALASPKANELTIPEQTATGKGTSNPFMAGKVTPLFATMLVQPTQDEGASSERPSEAQPTPSPAPTSEVPHEPQPDSSPAHTSEVPLEQQTDPSPRPSPTTTIPASIPETSGGNLGGHSSSDKSLSGNEGEMTLQSVYDLCLSLCAQVSDQAKEIQDLKAQITKLKKQAKPVIKHHKAWLKSVSLKQRFPRKSFSKKHRVHKESVSKQGRKFAKGEPSVQRDPLFDELPEDTVDHMETENAQDEGRTRDIVDGDKEIEENVLSTEDVLSTDKEGVSTDMEKVSTDRPIVSTDGSKVSTDRQNEGTNEQNEGTEEQVESTYGHKKGY